MSRIIIFGLMVGVSSLINASQAPVVVQKRGSLHSSTDSLRGSGDLKRSGAIAIKAVQNKYKRSSSSSSASPDQYDHMLPFHGHLRKNGAGHSPAEY